MAVFSPATQCSQRLRALCSTCLHGACSSHTPTATMSPPETLRCHRMRITTVNSHMNSFSSTLHPPLYFSGTCASQVTTVCAVYPCPFTLPLLPSLPLGARPSGTCSWCWVTCASPTRWRGGEESRRTIPPRCAATSSLCRWEPGGGWMAGCVGPWH